MKKRISLLIIILISILGKCYAQSQSFNVTKAEQTTMLDEAENWIDDMPESYQDLKSDAILHAMRGFFSELSQFRQMNGFKGKTNGVTVKNLQGGRNQDISMRIYSPEKSSGNLSCLIFFHEGGWSMSSIEESDYFCRKLAEGGLLKVVSVEYPLSPENPFPSAMIKCEEVIQYVFSKASELQIDPKKISVGGAGAGGNLAIGSVVKLNENKGNKFPVRSLVLYYPILNVESDKSLPGWKKYSKGYGFDSRLFEASVNSYLNNTSNVLNIPGNDLPYVSPINLSKTQLSTLPPVLMIAAGRDILIDWETEFINQIKGVGKKPSMVVFEGAIHGFLIDGHQPTALNKAVQLTRQFLQ